MWWFGDKVDVGKSDVIVGGVKVGGVNKLACGNGWLDVVVLVGSFEKDDTDVSV